MHDEGLVATECDMNQSDYCMLSWCYVDEGCVGADDVTASTIIPGKFYSYANCGSTYPIADDSTADDSVDGSIITGTITTPVDNMGDDVAPVDDMGDDVAPVDDMGATDVVPIDANGAGAVPDASAGLDPADLLPGLSCECLPANDLTFVYDMQQMPAGYGFGGCGPHDSMVPAFGCENNDQASCIQSWCYVGPDCMLEDVTTSLVNEMF